MANPSDLKQSQPNAQPQQPAQHEGRLSEAHAFFPQKSCRTPNKTPSVGLAT